MASVSTMDARARAVGAPPDIAQLVTPGQSGTACILHSGSAPAALLDAAFARLDVVCVDDDGAACRRVRALAQRHRGGTHAQVRLGPADAVVGPGETFDLIVDAALAEVTRASPAEVLTLVGPALRLAARHLGLEGRLVLQVADDSQARALSEHIADMATLRLVAATRSPAGTALEVQRCA